ncbi:MAG: OmpH family outer membrane protein [Simkaniaceae bacterium]|nr:OmpH family outer membrane protein [Simkaniaceae bacterium]
MKLFKILALASLIFMGAAKGYAASPHTQAAVVDFGSCIQQSKFGKREQEGFEQLKRQMHSILDDTEKQLNDVVTKLQDPDYLDTLSPEGEKELKVRFQSLQEELGRYQNHYYQILQQANMRMIHSLAAQINRASETIAKERKIPMVLNKDVIFYYDPTLDLTTVVIERMDKDYEVAEKSGTLPPTSQTMMPDPKQMMHQGPALHG